MASTSEPKVSKILVPRGSLCHLFSKILASQDFEWNEDHPALHTTNDAIFEEEMKALASSKANDIKISKLPQAITDRNEWVEIDLDVVMAIYLFDRFYTTEPNLLDKFPSDIPLTEVFCQRYPGLQVTSRMLYAMIKNAFFIRTPSPDFFKTIYIPIDMTLFASYEEICASKLNVQLTAADFVTIRDQIYFEASVHTIANTFMHGLFTEVDNILKASQGCHI